jgi:hypothetical protein
VVDDDSAPWHERNSTPTREARILVLPVVNLGA